MDRFFYEIPGLRSLASYVSQSTGALSFDELVEQFSNERDVDLVVFPEGSNCFFGPPEDVQPFRSARFVEIALRARSPLLLCVHRGSEDWGVSLQVDGSMIERLRALPGPVYSWLNRTLQVERRLQETGLVTLPSLPRPMERFDMLCELFTPTIQIENLPVDPAERKIRLSEQAKLIREQMKNMLAELDRQRAEGLRSQSFDQKAQEAAES
jgi:1-acyl-sn-glycerol-3-phosphate acyltransferase